MQRDWRKEENMKDARSLTRARCAPRSEEQEVWFVDSLTHVERCVDLRISCNEPNIFYSSGSQHFHN